MSRSGYSDDCDDDRMLAMWRGQVASAIRGKRGQAFLREMVDALDAMPEKRLIPHELKQGDAVCAIGSVGVRRGVDMGQLDPENYAAIAEVFGIARPLVQEIEYMNDESGPHRETPEQRWVRLRKWVSDQIRPNPASVAGPV